MSKPSVMFFKQLYSLDKRYRLSCSNLEFQKLLPSSSSALEVSFTVEGVKSPSWEYVGNKALFFMIIKKAWDIVGEAAKCIFT